MCNIQLMPDDDEAQQTVLIPSLATETARPGLEGT